MAAPLLSKFKGSLVGAVVGDCIGAVFEGNWGFVCGTEKVLKEIKKIDAAAKQKKRADGDESAGKKSKNVWTFTDDTAMARSVAQSLIQNNGLSVEDIAKRFTTEYFDDRHRGYGGGVVSVFSQLAENEYSDIFGPSRRQFDGQGSYGNGGSMRIAPAGLFVHKKNMDFKQLQDLVRQITLVTHSHRDAIIGSILQCYAVSLALRTDKLDVDSFIDELLKEIKPLEEEEWSILSSSDEVKETDTSAEKQTENTDDDEPRETYVLKLEKIREFAKQEKQPSNEDVDRFLGTDISALRSAPTALYCFLRSVKDIEGVDKEYNSFERTIIYAISLGGDTDTVATMAGAIAGAYYGLEKIPWTWQRCCEGVDDALMYAESLSNLK